MESIETKEITFHVTKPMSELIEFARNESGLCLSEFMDQVLRESPLLTLRNRMARIDFGDDASQPDWPNVGVGAKKRRRSAGEEQSTSNSG